MNDIDILPHKFNQRHSIFLRGKDDFKVSKNLAKSENNNFIEPSK